MAHIPKGPRVKTETDQEQHHNNTEFGHMLDVFSLASDQSENWAYGNAGCKIAEHRAKPQPGGQRYGNHRRSKIDQDLK